MKSTQAMRDRIRELMTDPIDDYDRAVLCVLNELEQMLNEPQAASKTAPVAWRVKNDFGHWHVTQDKALADTYRDVEKKVVQPLYLDAQPPAAPVHQEDAYAASAEAYNAAHFPSSADTAEAIRTATLWFEQQIENAQQDQIGGFAAGSGNIRGERAHARHCAMYEAQQVFLEAVRHINVSPQESPKTTDVLLEVAEPMARALRRCQTVLSNMAAENEGPGVFFFNRWPINHEPLRADARNLAPIVSQALSAYHAAFMKIERETSSSLTRPQEN